MQETTIEVKSTIEQIKEYLLQLNNKRLFAAHLANIFNKKATAVYQNWLCGFYSIPEKYQERVLKEVKEQVLINGNGNHN